MSGHGMTTRTLLLILKAGFCRNARDIIMPSYNAYYNVYLRKAKGNSKPLPFFNQTYNSIRSD